jgi:hypothetical protein
MALFHVKHQNKGDLPGMPIPRGNLDGVGLVLSRTWKAAPWRTRPKGSNPNSPRMSAFQRSVSLSSGGSETIRTPPIFKNRAAHSAVTAGGPNDRAVTSSNASESPGNRAISSARPMITSPRSGASGWASTSMRSLIRFSMESISTPRQFHRSSKTNPGSPPPLPRSRNSVGGLGRISSQLNAKPSAWAICTSIAAGPKKPRALDSSRARGNQ